MINRIPGIPGMRALISSRPGNVNTPVLNAGIAIPRGSGLVVDWASMALSPRGSWYVTASPATTGLGTPAGVAVNTIPAGTILAPGKGFSCIKGFIDMATSNDQGNLAVGSPIGTSNHGAGFAGLWLGGGMLGYATEIQAADSVLLTPASHTQVYVNLEWGLPSTAFAVEPMVVPLGNMREALAQKDALADAPAAGKFGLADAWASPLLGEAANNNAKTSAATFEIALPDRYVPGGPITLRIRVKVDIQPQVSCTIDAVVKEVNDGALGADICATAIQAVLGVAYADYDFTVTPAGLVPGDVLNVAFVTVNDDTAGAHGGVATVSRVELRPTVYLM